MSHENVEIARAGLEAYNRHDWGALLEYLAPDFVLDMSRSIGPQQGVFTLDEIRPYLEDFAATFESHRLEAEEFIEADDLVLVPNTAHITGRDGIVAAARTAFVFTFRNGLTTRLVMYQGRREALEAIGLAGLTDLEGEPSSSSRP